VQRAAQAPDAAQVLCYVLEGVTGNRLIAGGPAFVAYISPPAIPDAWEATGQIILSGAHTVAGEGGGLHLGCYGMLYTLTTNSTLNVQGVVTVIKVGTLTVR
jgi:hypothetical protein